MGVLRALQGFQGSIGQPTAQVIDGSLRIDAGSSQYLGRTPGSSGNLKTWTLSFWVKRLKYSGTQSILMSYNGSSIAEENYASLEFNSDNSFRIGYAYAAYKKTTRLFRDTGWYHIVSVVDTTQSTAGDRVQVYVNGVKETSFSATHDPDLNQDLAWNKGSFIHRLGSEYNQQYSSINLSQVYYVDGLALGPGYFGFTDPLTGTWRPKKFRAEGTTVNDGTVWSSLASVSSGSFQGSYPATNGFNGTLTSNDRANGDTNGSSIDLDFSSKNIIVKNDIAIWSGKSSIRYSINGGEYISYSDATEKWKTIPFSGKLVSLKIKHGSDSEQPGFSGLAVDGVTMLDSTTTNLAFGTNGYYLPMDNQDDFEKDKSGKGNDWTKNNFSGTSINPDVLKDSPSGAVFGGRAQTGITTTSSAPANYCTLNPLDKESNVVLSNGNLDGTASGGDGNYRGTIHIKTGKFYWEITQVSGGNYSTYGIIRSTLPISTLNTDTITYRNDGFTKKDGVDGSTFNSISGSDVLGVACDCDNNQISYYKNNTLQTTITFTTEMADDGVSAYGRWNNGKSADYNFGQKPFKYAPPQGFLPINSATVRPNKVVPRPDQYVGVTTYLGSSGNVVVDDLNHKPDAVIIKQYNAGGGTNDWVMVDSVRGRAKSLYPSATYSENTSAADKDLISFDRNGFTVGQTNQSAVNRGSSSYFYLAFAWKAGGGTGAGGEFWIDDVQYASASAAGLTGGDITPTGASVGTKQGFSIIKYDGTGSNATVPHGLNQKPNFFIIKRTSDTASWQVYSSEIGATKYLRLNTDAAAATSSIYYNDTEPTSSVFTVGTSAGVNGSGDSYISYLWHDVPGLQKFGSFQSNANADGPYVELGFRPAFVWVKVADAADNWAVSDQARAPFNPSDKHIRLNAPDAAVNDSGNYKIDYLSNGFKIRGTNGEYNANAGNDYVYMAWAEAPASNLFGGQSNAR